MVDKPAIHDFLSVDEQKLLMQLLPDEVVLVDPADQRIVYSNHMPAGVEQYNSVGLHYWQLAASRSTPFLKNVLNDAIAQQSIVAHEVELYFDGAYRWVLIRILPVMRDGALRYLLITHTNITALKNAISDLEFSQKRLKDHLDYTPLAAMMWDTAGITLEWNPAAESIFGFSREEALGRHFTDLIVPKDVINMHKAQFQETIRTGELDINPHAENLTKDGRIIQCEWFSTILRNSQGEIEGVAGLAQDITAKLLIEQEREAAKLAAEATANAKAQFLANMSHEIRTPLNGMIGMIEMMKLEVLDLDQQQKLNIIHQSSQTLLAILNDVLDFSKIESNAIVMEYIDVDINKLLSQVVSLMRPASEKKGLSLSFQPLTEPYCYIKGDPKRLSQILSNLISNAIKFTETGGVEVRTRFQRIDAEQIVLMIDVIDTGIGIKVCDLDHIFEDFSQADASITRRYGGTGLGLTICKRLAKLMQGDISVRSSYQYGSCFTFHWRAHTAVMPAKGSASTLEQLPQHFHGKVLLVDDNNINLMVGVHMLEALGLEVISARNGVEAVLMAEQHSDIVIILMDVHMPEMNGLDATKAIRDIANLKQVPILAVTANVLDSEWQQCREVGMNDWLAKPFTLNTLSEKLSNWLC